MPAHEMQTILDFGGSTAPGVDNFAAIENALNRNSPTVLGAPVCRFITAGTYELQQNLTINGTEALEFAPGAKLSISSGVTLTIRGRINAGRHQIFTGAGAVEFALRSSVVFPEWWGADPTGGAGTESHFDAAVKALPNGGTVLGGGPSAVYRLTGSPPDITSSYITLDFNWATLKSTGNHGFTFNGDAQVAGSWANAVKGCVFRNARIGLANDSSNKMRGPIFKWAEDCLVENVIRKGQGGTAFNLLYSKRTTFRNIWVYGSAESGTFGLLLHFGFECRVENAHFLDGPFPYALQVKGGENNVIENCSVENQVDPPEGPALVDVAFRDRGDAPGGPSQTSSTSTYPFPTQEPSPWAVADPRRHSFNTRFVNCSVRRSPSVIAFLAQESIGTRFEFPTADDVKIGVALLRTSAAQESDFTVVSPRLTNIGIQAAAASSGNGIRIAGYQDPEPANTRLLPGVQVIGGQIDTTYAHGIWISGAEAPLISGIHIKNPGRGDSKKTGVEVDLGTIGPRIIDVVVKDDGTATSPMTQGIHIEETTVRRPTIRGASVSGGTGNPIKSWAIGHYSDNNPGDTTAKTTNATVVDNRLRIYVPNDTAVWMEVTATARQGNTNRAVYRKGGLFYASGGTVTQQTAVPSPTITFVEIASDNTWGGLGFAVSGQYVLVGVTGKAATTIDWVFRVLTQVVE